MRLHNTQYLEQNLEHFLTYLILIEKHMQRVEEILTSGERKSLLISPPASSLPQATSPKATYLSPTSPLVDKRPAALVSPLPDDTKSGLHVSRPT